MAVVMREVEQTTQPETRELSGMAAWLTVERLLYAGALAVGAFMRFWQLGSAPLQPWEAANTWPAYLAAHAQTVTGAPAPTSALFYGLQWLLFWIGANGDAAARFAAATAGSVLVLWPWLWRGWIGRSAALALTWLVAFDPWLAALSRLADGASLGLALGMVALTGLMQLALHEDGRSQARWRWRTAVALGLLLVSGVLAWSWLPVLLGFGWLYQKPLRRAGVFAGQTLLWAGLSAALGASLGLARLDGVAWIGTSLTVWLGQLTDTGGYGVGWPWIRLLVDQPLVMLLGTLGLLGIALRRHQGPMPKPEAWTVLLWGWLAWGGVLCLLPGRGPMALPMLGLPLLIGAAWLVAALVTQRPHDLDGREVGAIYATLLILVVSGSFWAAALFFSRVYDPVMAQATGVIFLLAAAILVIYALWANRVHAAWITLSAATVLLGMAALRSSWQLNQMNGPAHVDGFFARQTHPEIRLLVEDIETLSAHRTGTPHQLPLLVQVASYTTAAGEAIPALPDPVLGWYLRGMQDVTWTPAPAPAGVAAAGDNSAAPSRPLAITLLEQGNGGAAGTGAPGYGLPDGYIGSVYHVESSWLPKALASGPEAGPGDPALGAVARRWTPWLQPLARWVIYRVAPVPAATRDVILWVDQTPE
jgi:hypothetical protein